MRRNELDAGLIFWIVGLALLLSCGCGAADPAKPVQTPDGDQTDEAACASSRDCAIGLFCSASGVCLSRCASDVDCVGGLCEQASGACRECMNDARCREQKKDEAAYCDLEYHVCRVGCEACVAGQECLDGRCSAPLTSDGDREADGEAEVVEAELEAATCPNVGDKLCQAGCRECASLHESRACLANGTGFTSEPCLVSEYCAPATGLCVAQLCTPDSTMCDGAVQKTCAADGSYWIENPCPASQICASGACVDRICTKVENPPVIFRFDARSAIASPDRSCRYVANRGSAAWGNDLAHRGFLHFAGANSASLPAESASFSSHLLISVLIRPTKLSGSQSVLAKGYPASISLRLEEDKPFFALNTDGQLRTLSGNCSLRLNEWQWLLATFDGTTIALYKDGSLCGAPVVLGSPGALRDNAADYRLGAADADKGGYAQFFSGDIDIVYFGKTLLGPNEIAQFDGAKGDPCPPSVADLRANYCPGLCKTEQLVLPPSGVLMPSKLALTPGEAFLLDPGGCVRPTESLYQHCIPAAGTTVVSCPGCPAGDKPKYALLMRFVTPDMELFGTLDARQALVVPAKGSSLEFMYNDDNPDDNSGGFVVYVERGYCPLGLCEPGRSSISGLDYCCKEGQLPLNNGLTCIDRYEASCEGASDVASDCGGGKAPVALSVPAVQPWVDVAPEEAKLACERAAKYACTLTEWQAACGGAQQNPYPYGDTYQNRTCNDAVYTPAAPYTTLLPGGYLSGCVSDRGVFDLSGNAGEFVLSGTSWKVMGGKNQEQSRCVDGVAATSAGTQRGFRCCTRYSSIPE